MEGLVKGLIDMALGHHDDNRREGDEEDSSSPQSREERSRSTWAEVVSGEQDEGAESRAHRHGSTQNQEEGRFGREELGDSGSRHSRRPQQLQTVQEGYEENQYSVPHNFSGKHHIPKERREDDNDGWETVAKKPQREHHKIQMDHWHGYKLPPSEQSYSDEVEIGSKIEPLQEELSDLSQACNKLWELDLNRLVPGKDYEIDCGDGKKVYNRADMAQGSLFTWVSEDVLRRPTFSRFCSLLDNYNPNERSKEVVTSEEKQEQLAFIEEISRTAPIKYLHKYLLALGRAPNNYEEFKRMLLGLWFDLYGRGGVSGSSSAFEHVFVGEIKQRDEQEVCGFHNWLQFYLEEAKGNVDYQGYIFPRRRGETPDSETQLLTLQFEWNGILKSVSSSLIGVSPEFEMALYSLCYYVGQEDNCVQLGPYPVNIKCYRFGDRIGSVFPVAES